jgi:hypothetical protein
MCGSRKRRDGSANSSYGKSTNFAAAPGLAIGFARQIDRCRDTTRVAPQSCESYVERLGGQQKSPDFALAMSGGFEDAR